MAMLSGRKSLGFKPEIRSLSQFCALTCFVLTDCIVGLVETEFLLLAIISVTSENLSGITIASDVDGNAVRRKSLEFKPQVRLSSKFCAFTCFVLTDCVAGLVGIRFPLLAIISVTSETRQA